MDGMEEKIIKKLESTGMQIVKKIMALSVFTAGQLIQASFVIIAFLFTIEGKRLEMWIYVAAAYIFQLILVKYLFYIH